MQEPGWMRDILEARDRTACGPVAPADGLYLERVMYEGDA
jgi:tRNA pseudouridine38-40 synthase